MRVETVEERSNDDIPVSFEPSLHELGAALLLEAGDVEGGALHQYHVVRQAGGDEYPLYFHNAPIERIFECLFKNFVSLRRKIDVAGFYPVVPRAARVPCSHH